jgi:hypothetical protein
MVTAILPEHGPARLGPVTSAAARLAGAPPLAVPAELMSRRRALPDGITIEQIATALEAITTARVSLCGTTRVKGTDTPVRGDGLVDFSRHLVFISLAVNGRQVEVLTVGRDRFRRLSPGRQRETGKLWLRHTAIPLPWHNAVCLVMRMASRYTRVASGARWRRSSSP